MRQISKLLLNVCIVFLLISFMPIKVFLPSVHSHGKHSVHSHDKHQKIVYGIMDMQCFGCIPFDQ
eukprot:c36374_g1_i1 orf=3-194(-)